MITSQLINGLIPSVSPTDTVLDVQDWMDEFRVSQLPVVENKRYKGLIKDTQLLAFADDSAEVGNFELVLKDTFATEHQHFFDVLHLFHEFDVELIPVLNHEKEYLGVISIKDSAKILSKAFSAEMQGGILILSIDYRDYSMSEIGRLIESNNAKIVSSFLEVDPVTPTKLELTLKLNTPDLTRIVATLERFGYKIISRFQKVETESFNSERLGSLMKYLEM